MNKLKEEVKKKRLDKIMEAEGIVAQNAKGDTLLKNPTDPLFLGTNPFYLSATQPLKAIQMFLPPGISRFFIERIDRNHFRFLISKAEMEKMSEKVETIEKAINDGKKND